MKDDILTEDMRILAGIEDTKKIKNPLPEIIKKEKEKIRQLKERERRIDSTVMLNLENGSEKLNKFNNDISNILSIVDDPEKRKIFVENALRGKYKHLKKILDVLINDGIILFVGEYIKFKSEIDKEITDINLLTEECEISSKEEYYVYKDININDRKLYMDKEMNNPSNIFIIESSSMIIPLSSKLTLIKMNGKRYYSNFDDEEIEKMKNDGILI